MSPVGVTILFTSDRGVAWEITISVINRGENITEITLAMQIHKSQLPLATPKRQIPSDNHYYQFCAASTKITLSIAIRPADDRATSNVTVAVVAPAGATQNHWFEANHPVPCPRSPGSLDMTE